MATANRNRVCLRPRTKNLTDFSKVGGLSNHIILLREIIIFPLLYGDLYKHFNVKAPRGVLFFGPPGTGKTLVAGALATELNREGNGKVTFYQRKGADILDKWVGESERKLRDLFNQATRSRPSVIFFDELDGLAPVRSQKNDQVHCSVVATLLALMDGLDNMPGVIVIGATNRIDAIDPALRRPGRFDRELYFPLPSVGARKEILQVHTQSWKRKPSADFLIRLSELTSGCCGSDLQALCAEAVLCCLKRLYPNIHRPMMGNKVKINIENTIVEEIDFLNARMNLVPTSQRLGNYRVRKLSPFIKPLLQRQLDKIVRRIQVLLPQFTEPFKKFLIGNERYAGRLVLKGNNQQGLTVHIIPAILQTLEHIPCYMLDIPALFESNIKNARQNLPSILVLSRVDDWWDLIDSSTQLGLTAMLEDLHAGLPLFLIATCGNELPIMLQEYFYSNSSIVIKLEDPTAEEREQFFAPLFFGNNDFSVNSVLKNKTVMNRPVIKKEIDAMETTRTSTRIRKKVKGGLKSNELIHTMQDSGIKRQSQSNVCSPLPVKRSKGDRICGMSRDDSGIRRTSINQPNTGMNNYCKNARKYGNRMLDMNRRMSSRDVIAPRQNIYDTNTYPSDVYVFEGSSREENRATRYSNANQTLMDMINSNSMLNCSSSMENADQNSVTSLFCSSRIKQEPVSDTSLLEYHPYDTNYYTYGTSTDSNVAHIFNIWKRAAHISSDGLPVGQLELLYDIISACISLNRYNFHELMQALEVMLANFENGSKNNEMDGSVDS